MYDEIFADKLSKLRIHRGVSARNMSLSLGQSADYINKIENKKLFPSMQVFFNMCEYLEITPSDFFNMDLKNPKLTNDLIENIGKLDDESKKIILDLTKKLNTKT